MYTSCLIVRLAKSGDVGENTCNRGQQTMLFCSNWSGSLLISFTFEHSNFVTRCCKKQAFCAMMCVLVVALCILQELNMWLRSKNTYIWRTAQHISSTPRRLHQLAWKRIFANLSTGIHSWLTKVITSHLKLLMRRNSIHSEPSDALNATIEQCCKNRYL